MTGDATSPVTSTPEALLRRYQTLLQATDVIHACQNLDELFKKLAETVRKVVAYDAVAVSLVDESKENIRVALFESWVPNPTPPGLTLPVSELPAGWVMEQQKPLRVVTAENDARFAYHNKLMRDIGFGVSFHLPLSTPKARLGELIFAFQKVVDVPEIELQFMQSVADQVALAIENARNFEEAQRAHAERQLLVDRYETLLEASDVIHGCQDLDDLFRKLATTVRALVPFDAFAIGLVEPDGKSIRLAMLESWHPQPVRPGLVVPLDDVPAGWVMSHQRPIRVVIDPNEKTFATHHGNMSRAGLGVSYHLPLTTAKARLGELVFSFREVVEVPAAEIAFLQRVADQAATAIENASNFETARRAHAELERVNQQRESLLHLTNNIVSQRELGEVLRIAVKSIHRIVPCALAAVALPAPDGKNLRLATMEFPGGKGILKEGLLMPIAGSNVGRAFATQQSFVVNEVDPQNYSSELLRIITEEGLRGQVFVPLVSRGRSLGTLGMSRLDSAPFTADEVGFLNDVAAQVTIALENALYFEELRTAEREVARERDRSQLLLEVNNAVVSHLDLDDLVKSISESLRRVVPHDAAAFSLYNEETGMIQGLALHREFDDKGVFEHRKWLDVRGTPEGEAITTRRPVRVEKMDMERFNSPLVRKAYEGGVKSGCAVPLISHGRLIGLMSVVSLREAAFGAEDEILLDQCSSQIAIALENALAYREITKLKDRLAQEKLYLEDEIRSETHFDEIVGQSAGLKEVLRMVETVAATDSTVLLLGETGTGKELIARAVHQRSRRNGRTFVKLNCAAIPTGLLESELFGHERGAFTGAISQKIGRLELADQGTLFLDEVGDVPVEIQPKLLRALQEREFERLGSTHTKKVNIRMVAATNRDLEKMIADREFRSDLYYRLNVFPIRIPPLRDRREDIPLLVRYFVQKFSRQMQKHIETIPTSAMNKLQAWHWPGNVRELENFIERSVILTTGTALHVQMAELESSAAAEAPSSSLRDTERDHILQVLKETKWVLAGPAGAAARLGLKRTTLQSKMKKLGIIRDSA